MIVSPTYESGARSPAVGSLDAAWLVESAHYTLGLPDPKVETVRSSHTAELKDTRPSNGCGARRRSATL